MYLGRKVFIFRLRYVGTPPPKGTKAGPGLNERIRINLKIKRLRRATFILRSINIQTRNCPHRSPLRSLSTMCVSTDLWNNRRRQACHYECGGRGGVSRMEKLFYETRIVVVWKKFDRHPVVLLNVL